MATISQLDEYTTQGTQEYREPNKTFLFSQNQIAGKTDQNLECVKQAVFHILSTERYAYPIYDDNYGVEFEQYIGKSFAFFQASIAQTLAEALSQDDRITGIDVESVTQISKDSCAVSFSVATIYGSFRTNQTVSL